MVDLVMKIKPFKEAHTKAWRSLLKKNKKENHFSFFMLNYIISDNSVTYKTQILCTYCLSSRVGWETIFGSGSWPTDRAQRGPCFMNESQTKLTSIGILSYDS